MVGLHALHPTPCIRQIPPYHLVHQNSALHVVGVHCALSLGNSRPCCKVGQGLTACMQSPWEHQPAVQGVSGLFLEGDESLPMQVVP